MQANFPAALAFVLKHEGLSFEDVPGDSGGPTKAGLTFRDVAQHRGIPLSKITTHAQEITLARSLTTAEMQAIYKTKYWGAVEGDLLPAPLDLITFDAAVNMGVGTAIKMLDQAADLPAHLAPDAALMARLKAKAAVGKIPQVADAEFAERIARYHAIVRAHPVDEKFLHGWLNRAAHCARPFSLKPNKQVSSQIKRNLMKITQTVPKATAGPLAGFATIIVTIALLLSALSACQFRGVSYGLGSKPPEPFSVKPNFRLIDCSGFVRWALWVATRGQLLLPDGSYVQHDWFTKQGFKLTDYANAALQDGHLRIAFHAPNGRGGDGTGHVWLIYAGETLESYGGHGPGRREWDHDWFTSHVDACYVIC